MVSTPRTFSIADSRKGPGIFNRLSQSFRRYMVRRGFTGTVAFIDDFFLAAPTYEECNKWLHILLKLLRKLGFYISYKKVVGPTHRVTFLGMKIDTCSGTLSLGQDKLQRLKQQFRLWRKRASSNPWQACLTGVPRRFGEDFFLSNAFWTLFCLLSSSSIKLGYQQSSQRCAVVVSFSIHK